MAELGRTLPFPLSLSAQAKPSASSCLFIESSSPPSQHTRQAYQDAGELYRIKLKFHLLKEAFPEMLFQEKLATLSGLTGLQFGLHLLGREPLEGRIYILLVYSHCCITPATHMPIGSAFLNEEEREKYSWFYKDAHIKLWLPMLISGARAGVKGCAWTTVCASFLARTRCQPCNFCLR